MKLNRNDKFLLVVIIFIIIVVISLFVSLFLIWSPKEENKINSYSYAGFEEEVVTMYQKQLQILLKQNNTKLLAEKLDPEFLSNKNLSSDNLTAIKKYMEDNKLVTTTRAAVTGYTVSSNEETGVVVYRFKYYNMYGFERYVNLIETEPYVYTISFEDGIISTSAKKSIIDSYEKIKFEITLQESTSNSLKYNLKITNNSDEIVKFNFNDVSAVELTLNDGDKIKLSSVIATSEEEFMLTQASYINQELFFVVPIESQGNIKNITFYNVQKGENKINIKIDF